MAQLVEASHYKPEDRGFDSHWGSFGIFHCRNPSVHTMALGTTQPVT